MKTVEEEGLGTVEIFPLPAEEALLKDLLTEVFRESWREIRFGILIQGAVFEIAAPGAPQRISMRNGYLRVDFGAWHFQLCIGEHRGSPERPVSSGLAIHRRTARAEFYRVLGEDAPTSWGLRLFNGAGEQQLTVMLPHPFLAQDMSVLAAPDWSRLALWDRLRKRYLELDADPRDRSGRRFVHR